MSKKQNGYSFFRNWKYALSGFSEVFRNEKAFRLEIFIFLPMLIAVFCLDVSSLGKILLFFAVFTVLITELLNSAIERVVDLVTTEHKKLAGHAKDAASAAVMFGNFLVFLTFLFVLSDYFEVFNIF